MAVRRRDTPRAACETQRKASLGNLESLLEASHSRWPVSSLKRALQQLRLARGGRACRSGASPSPRGAASSKGSELSTSSFAAGTAAFAALVFLSGAYPWALPWVLLGFSATGLPYRVFSFGFVQPVNRFFLLDFCYFVNAATVAYLLLPALHCPQLEASVYALADGPVAAALVVWECAWVFSSPEHTLSVLIHLLPGLAMYAHRHLPRVGLRQLRACALHLRAAATALHVNSCLVEGAAQGEAAGAGAAALEGPLAFWLRWLFLAPLAFYAAWQALYWVVVQVLLRSYIKQGGFDTSYKCLARRHQRSRSLVGRLVLRGSTARRLLWFGLMQLAFTIAALLIFAPTYYSFHLAFLWQAVKFGVPLYHGAKYQCERLIKAAIADGIRQYHLTVDARLGADGKQGLYERSNTMDSTPPAASK